MKIRSTCAVLLACIALAACQSAPLYEPGRRALVAAQEDEERTVVAEISRTRAYTPDVLIQIVHNPADSGKL
ncbi:hypothetical protein ABIC94_002481 [Variovorax paradoxus]|jgi:hypothetical protein|uniref:hypothetical protein n=1 Tax=Variovorax paradoxus TaxID=34073 RepID=UPI00339A9292